MTRTIAGVGALLVIVIGYSPAVPADAITRGAGAGKILKFDPAFDALVPANATIERIVGGFEFQTEGPVWSRDGSLLFAAVVENKIYRLTKDGKVSVFRDRAGHPNPPAVAPGSPGSEIGLADHQRVGPNGLTYDKEGRLIFVEMGNRRVVRLEANSQLTVLADKVEGKRLNKPNDIVVKSDGSIYFTDLDAGMEPNPTTGVRFGCVPSDCTKELAYNAVYRIANGTVQRVTTDDPFPNGIAFSPDERFLYVTKSDPATKFYGWLRYEVKPDGTLSPASVLYDSKQPGQDGMKVDSAGNLWATGANGVWVISPAGKLLGRIEPLEAPANCAWGGDDGKTFYMTGRTSIYRIRVSVKGKRPCCD